MDEIHLDPSCDFVAIKSAESDGVQFNVALQHYQECERCQGYHALVVKKANLLQHSIKRVEKALSKEEDDKHQEELENRKANEARLNLVLAHLEGYPEFIIKTRFTHSPALDSGVLSESTVRSDYGDVHIAVRSSESGYTLRMPHWETTRRLDSAEKVVVGIAEDIARTRFKTKKAPASARGHADET